MPALVTFEILSEMLGGVESLSYACQALALAQSTSSYIQFSNAHSDWLAGILIPLADYRNHRFVSRTGYYLKINNNIVGYDLVKLALLKDMSGIMQS